MHIKEVCRCCRLTRKAVAYYEEKGLLVPTVLENGYREYGERELSALKEISVLRQCGLSVADIAKILTARDKSAALTQHLHGADLQLQRLEARHGRMEALVQSYDIDETFAELLASNEDSFTLRERLTYAFPGGFGVFLSLHFGAFLGAEIDTPEKREAYIAMLDYLDEAELHLFPGIDRAAHGSAFLSQTRYACGFPRAVK